MTESDTQKLADDSSNSNNQIPLVLSILAVLLAVVGVILGAVSLSQNGTNYYTINSAPAASTPSSSFAMMKGFGLLQTDTKEQPRNIYEVSGQIKGFDVDIVNAVCKIAGKNCRWVEDVFNRCWDSELGQQQRGGIGLHDGYYDGCTAWFHSRVRARTFQFSDAFSEGNKAYFIVKKGNPDSFDPLNLDGKTIGFVDGLVQDEHCLARELPGSFQGESIPLENVRHYNHREDFVAAINNGEVDAAFDDNAPWLGHDDVDIVAFEGVSCYIGGRSIMTRKDNRLNEWWNPAFATLLASYEYRLICKDLLEQHGHLPGPTPEDICFGYKAK